MNRIELKNWAKEKIDGNKLELWKGIILIMAISFAVSIFESSFQNNKELYNLVTFLIDIILLPITIGLIHFFIKFVKTNEIDKNVLFEHYSEFWKIVGTMLLVDILIIFGAICFIVPGIILAFSYSLVPYLIVERKDLTITQTLELSRKMMYGHKLDSFVLALSFLGWILLSVLTLGILLIWLYPYMETTMTKFYLDIIENYEG